MLSWVEHAKSFITSGPVFSLSSISCAVLKKIGYKFLPSIVVNIKKSSSVNYIIDLNYWDRQV